MQLYSSTKAANSSGDPANGVGVCEQRYAMYRAPTALKPESKNYIRDRPPRAGGACQGWITHIENEGRLPRGIAHDIGKQARVARLFSQRFFVVDHFHRLIAGPSGHATRSGQQVRPLPGSSRA